MMCLKRILSMLLCLVLLIGAFCGCGDKYKEAIIYFELLQQPKTLDPQIASDDSELLIVRNIYEGLLRIDKSGEIVNGVSESYTYENLTYTFKLKNDAFWSNGNKVTAFDFQYAFRRAVDPQIKAPFVSRLFAIENAEAIANGSADVATLGVKAVDDTTLIITLCREDNDFLKTLTTSICMPCNEKFFEESIGKYGLDAKCILSNGSYRLTKWNKEEFGIRIYNNEKYNGVAPAQNAAVFISCIDDEKQTERLGSGSDMAFIDGVELADAKNAGHIIKSVQNICWIMTISHNYNSEVRRAFVSAFDTSIYQNSLSDSFATAKSVYPDILGINADGIGITSYNIDEAKSVISAQITNMEDKKFPPSTLYYYDVDGTKDVATAIVGHWQQNLSTFINIEASNNLNALQSELSNSTLDFALFPITAKSTYFNEYAKTFVSKSQAATPDLLQQEMLSDYSVMPVAYQNTNIAYVPSLEEIIIDQENGYVDFSYIIKK